MLMAAFGSHIVDVKGAFLHSEFDNGEVIYFKVPQGFETYYDDPKLIVINKIAAPAYIKVIDIILLIYFMADWLLFFYLHHEDRIVFLFGFDSFLNFLTIVPTFIIRFGIVE